MIPLDKQAHFFAGVAIASTVTLYTAQPIYGIAATVASAALKEVLDILGMGTPDADDFVATVLGCSVLIPLML